MEQQTEVKHRADLKECINDLHERLKIIESKFNIYLNQEQKDLWNDLKRDILVPLESSAPNCQQHQESLDGKGMVGSSVPSADTNNPNKTDGDSIIPARLIRAKDTPESVTGSDNIHKEIEKEMDKDYDVLSKLNEQEVKG